MKFAYTSHFKFRAKERKIPLKLAKEVFDNADEWYFDDLRGHRIAIARVEFKGRARRIMLAYDIIGETIEFITIHAIREAEVKNKVNSGRWKHEEK